MLIGGPPKTGNVWVQQLLTDVLDLEIVGGGLPGVNDPEGLRRFIGSGGFPEGSILAQHYFPTPEFLEVAAEADVFLVAVLRNPYDTFVSLYFYVQNFAHMFESSGAPEEVLIDKPIDHPDAIAFIGDWFRVHLSMALEWSVGPGGAAVVRYEDLKRDPIAALRPALEPFGPVDAREVQRVMERTRPDRMRRWSDQMQRHVRSATVGDWRNHLGPAHLDALRRHEDLIRALGYDVEAP